MSTYRHLVVEDALPPPTGAELAALERELGAALPPSFVAFLREANGGWLDYAFDVPVQGGALPVTFHSLHSSRLPSSVRPSPGAMLHEIVSERRAKGIERGVLPFASNGGASIAYLDLTQEGNGRVVAFIEGLPGWDGEPASAFVTLAPDFDAFVSGLYLNLEEPRRHGE